jgi:hypothetical protein
MGLFSDITNKIVYRRPDKKKSFSFRQNLPNAEKTCPLINDPYEDCYCFKLNTQEKIKKSIYYCGENFKECEIYISYKAAGR